MKSMPMIKAMAIAAHKGRKTNTRRLGDQCKYNVGDICYIQEDYWQIGHWEQVNGVLTKGGKQKWKFVPDSDEIFYEAPEEDMFESSRWKGFEDIPALYKRIGRFMPERYSRTKIEVITKTREALQDISEEDAIAEGVHVIHHGREGTYYHHTRTKPHPKNWLDAQDAFRELWISINGPDSWNANPQVWRIEFRRVKP